MQNTIDDEYILEALAMSDSEFQERVNGIIRKGLEDGDIGYAYWSDIARTLKMARMKLVLASEGIKHILADPDSINKVRDVLEQWMQNPSAVSRAQKWQKILQEQDWTSVLEISKEGMVLRELSPMQFALPADINSSIARRYYR